MVNKKSVYQPLDASDTLFESVQDYDIEMLARIFDLKDPNSEFSAALVKLMIRLPENSDPFFIMKDAGVSFNLSQFLEIVSAGSVDATLEDRKVSYVKKINLIKIFKLIGLQSRVEKYLASVLNVLEIEQLSDFEMRSHSLALGLCMNVLLQRFGVGAKTDFARWLADISSAPLRHRTTLIKIQKIQILRTKLSGSFAGTQSISNKSVQDEEEKLAKLAWQGQPVCAGSVTAQVLRIRNLKSVPDAIAGKILVFQYAKPDAVIFFESAAGILFANGGVLSHACVVSREMAKPAITALGSDFWKQIEDGVTVTMDGLRGSVTVHQEK